MENEEKKNVCCGDKVGCCESNEKCGHGMSHCCHNWKKCRMIKWIIVIVALIIAFCLGSQWGERNGEWRNYRFERGGMMNWGYNQLRGGYNNLQTQKTADEVTVKVEGTQASTTTTSPKQ